MVSVSSHQGSCSQNMLGMFASSSEVDRIRDIDLHPDSTSLGVLSRAKRQLNESFEDPESKLRKVKAAAEAFVTDVPSARAIRAARREAVANCATVAQRAVASLDAAVLGADQRLSSIEDAVGTGIEAIGTHAIEAAQASTAAVGAGMQAITEHATMAEQVIEQGCQALQEQALHAARASLRTAMSYMPGSMLAWSSALGSSRRSWSFGAGSNSPLSKPTTEKQGVQVPPFAEPIDEENSRPQTLRGD